MGLGTRVSFSEYFSLEGPIFSLNSQIYSSKIIKLMLNKSKFGMWSDPMVWIFFLFENFANDDPSSSTTIHTKKVVHKIKDKAELAKMYFYHISILTNFLSC